MLMRTALTARFRTVFVRQFGKGSRSIATAAKLNGRQFYAPFVFSTAAAIVSGLYLSLHDSLKLDVQVALTPDEIRKHNRPEDCWIVINNNVYDLSEFLHHHPGGAGILLKYAGKDATSAFSDIHSPEVIISRLTDDKFLGNLVGEFEEEVEELTEEEIQRLSNIDNKPPLDHIFNLLDFEYVAKQILPKTSYTYYATGCDDEFSMRENHYAYNRVFFRPRVLSDTRNVDLSTQMLGSTVEVPIYITAFAGSKLAHPLAEKNLCKGAYREGIIEMIPTQLSFPFKEFVKEIPSDQNHWAQLHFYSEEDVKNSKTRFQRFEETPSIKGVFINADIAALGNREKDRRVRTLYDKAGTLSEFTSAAEVRPTLTWDDIKRMRSETSLPIALKGVQCAADVLIAAEIGLNGVILSNHGGRQLDFSMPPLEVLAEAKPLLRSKGLDDKLEIYIDGGIRRGSDILKALCLGAKGVGLGRPFLYSMAGYGEEGVVKTIQILKQEMERDMKLLGVNKISDLNESLVDISGLKIRSNGSDDRLYDGAYEPVFFPRFRNE